MVLQCPEVRVGSQSLPLAHAGPMGKTSSGQEASRGSLLEQQGLLWHLLGGTVVRRAIWQEARHWALPLQGWGEALPSLSQLCTVAAARGSCQVHFPSRTRAHLGCPPGESHRAQRRWTPTPMPAPCRRHVKTELWCIPTCHLTFLGPRLHRGFPSQVAGASLPCTTNELFQAVLMELTGHITKNTLLQRR